MTPREKIETLRKKLTEATPGPWVAGRHQSILAPANEVERELALFIAADVGAAQRDANMTLTEAMHRALPALLNVAEKALAWCEWAQRGAPCDIPPGECRACELMAALARLGEGE